MPTKGRVVSERVSNAGGASMLTAGGSAATTSGERGRWLVIRRVQQVSDLQRVASRLCLK